ncbi:hypothetical protein, conserved [Trypanosoma brucei brucei TREU927]|uniref:Flagellar attachment zone protein 1 conserved domain-containing protein n=1 Tax=Trypanosoma brucei brucei (strain 927/4 GUTat10.1) TaxID=185431 RepID=Q38FS0_TRYB2|nr:hypothetical protein, conserved [Trypanosoma brucei brucei TREU927]EAN76350.1 hypothetical protein, conserved [Trypanosoma brucei brucei TREU927]
MNRSCLEVNVSDYICLERIGGDYEWSNTLARVIGLPTSQHVRVELFDRVDAVPGGFEPYDEKLGELAVQQDRLDGLNELKALQQQYQQLVEDEDRSSERLYRAREVTQEKQAIAAAFTRQQMVELDQVRAAIEQVPARSWRELRSAGRPSEELFSLVRALMIALQEDHNGSWESMQIVMRQSDFVGRIMELDCTVAPLSKLQRKKIKNELALVPAESLKESKRKGASSQALQGAPLPVVIRRWLNVQMACSRAREAEERVVDGCFAQLQEQALLITEVNGLREMIAMLGVQISEKKQALIGEEPLNLLNDEEEPINVEGCYVQRTTNGRVVSDIVSLDSVLLVFGPKESKTLLGKEIPVYVQLQPEEVLKMQQTVRTVNDLHDIDELEALFAAEERDDQEKRELQLRMEELSKKELFTEDDEEEMRQLDAFLTDVDRRHERTVWRRRCLEKAGRDKLYLEKRRRIENTVYSDLHIFFTGDKWQEVLDNEEHREYLDAAFKEDASATLRLPKENFTNLTFEGYPLEASFTTEHDKSTPKEELQALLERCAFPTVCAFYHSLTGGTTKSMSKLRIDEWLVQLRRERMWELNFAGSGLVETLEDFGDEDYGYTDDEDYRKPCVEIAEVRCDYDPAVRYGYALLGYNEAADDFFDRGGRREQQTSSRQASAVRRDQVLAGTMKQLGGGDSPKSDGSNSDIPGPEGEAPTAAEHPADKLPSAELEELSFNDVAAGAAPGADEPSINDVEELGSEDASVQQAS